MPHNRQVPRIYRADHTAHIRDRLKSQALYFSTGVIMAVLGAIAVAVLRSLLGEAHHALTVAVWGLVIVLAVVSGFGLTLTGIEYLVYRRRRAGLDAAGAEVIGELYARLHRPNDNQ
jgi:hypothetical protein